MSKRDVFNILPINSRDETKASSINNNIIEITLAACSRVRYQLPEPSELIPKRIPYLL